MVLLCTLPKMGIAQNRIALVFDFDDTLSDDSTTKLLEAYGINAVDFWQKQAKSLVDQGWNPTLAYLKLILDNVGPGKKFGKLSSANLKEFGQNSKFAQIRETGRLGRST